MQMLLGLMPPSGLPAVSFWTPKPPTLTAKYATFAS